MNITGSITRSLRIPELYSLTMKLLDSDRARRIYVSEYLKVDPTEKVLDLGCGPADILDYLPEVDYLGIDSNEKYIQKANKKYGSRGKFLLLDLGHDPIELNKNGYDLVMLNGVLHHLNDSEALSSLSLARESLHSGGRLVSIDGCWTEKQSRITRFLLANDRGSFVRKKEEYIRLAEKVFPLVKSHIRKDLLRIPYTHIIMECRT